MAAMALVWLLPFLFSFQPTLASFIVDKVTAKAATCEPVLLQWQGGKAPWTLGIVAPDGTTFENLGPFKGTSFHWPVDLEAGTVVAAQLTDSTGATATGNSFTIQSGTTGCTLREFLAQPADAATSETEIQTSTAQSQSTPAETQTTEESSSTEPSASSAADPTTVIPSRPTSTAASNTSTKQTSTEPPVASGPTASATTSSGTQYGPYSESSPSASALAYEATRRRTNVGTVFAILIPCLILLVILGLLFLRWRRRRRGTASRDPERIPEPFALETQEAPPRWFDKPSYARAFGRRSSQLETPPGPSTLKAQTPAPRWFNKPEYQRGSPQPETREAELQRPTLNIATGPAAAPAVHSEGTLAPGTLALTPGPVLTYTQLQTSADSKSPVSNSTVASPEVQTLQAQIHALIQENAVLSSLANPPADSPPPAYV